MAIIITIGRAIIVEETFEIISDMLHRDWISVTEYSVHVNQNLDEVISLSPIKINTSHIIEVQP